MKELTKEEKLEQRISNLERQIYEKDNAFDKEQGKRTKRTFFVLSGFIYLTAFIEGEISGDIKAYLGWLIVAPVLAGLTMLISLIVTLYISTGAMKRAETIGKLKGRLEEIKFGKYE